MNGSQMLDAGAERATSLERAILRSVVYAALFEYPLTLDQLRRTLEEAIEDDMEIVRCHRSSAFLCQHIEYRDGYFFPRGRGEWTAERHLREARSRALLDENRGLLKLICSVPYTRLVALSGSAAHLNVNRYADLDLFVVTRRRRVWSVAVSILLLAKLVGRRRLVCVNYVLSDERLRLDQQDLFTANQIIHLKPLVGGDLYRRFVDANPFVAALYPNFLAGGIAPGDDAPGPTVGFIKRVLERLGELGLSDLFEAVCREAYSRYLRRRAASWRSPNQVRLERDCLKLHTNSHRNEILNRYAEALASITVASSC